MAETKTPASALIPMFIMSALNGAWIALVLHKLYGWYALPLGAPYISWAETWGLMLLLGGVVYVVWQPKSNLPWREALELLVTRFLMYALLLLFGWLIKALFL